MAVGSKNSKAADLLLYEAKIGTLIWIKLRRNPAGYDAAGGSVALVTWMVCLLKRGEGTANVCTA